MPILSVRHLTRYRYRKPVAFGEHRMMLRPQESADQRLLDYTLTVSPEPTPLTWSRDSSGNAIAVARFMRKAKVLSAEAVFTVDHNPVAVLGARGEPLLGGGQLPVSYDDVEMKRLARFIRPQHADPSGEVREFAQAFVGVRGPTPVLGLLVQMTHAIRSDFTYGRRLSGGPQTPEQTLNRRAGACRDYAVLLMEAARSLGLAARFVSGYLVCAPGKAEGKGDGARVGGGHTHAWAQVYVPGAGWVDFDPTNGIVGAQGLIRVAAVREPRAACVLSGDYDGDAGDCLGMDVEVEVTELSDEATVRFAA
ncbi:transglutaminase family protein [soil metagenome]